MNRNLNEFTKQLGYGFKDNALLERALLHDSAAAKNNLQTNERLEFLGDRVLALVIADILIKRFADENEGALARRLASLVSRDSCAQIAKQWALDRFIITDKKSKRAAEAGDMPRNIMADGCEAILGAAYLDGGLSAAQKIITTFWEDMITAQINPPQDAKTALQEYAMKNKLDLPIYETIDKQGPDHAPHFMVSVRVAEKTAQGQGASVRVAQAQAAQAWLAEYKSDDE